MKLLSALFVIGVLSKADSRALENGDSRIINRKEMDVNDYPFMVEPRVVENGDSRIIGGKEVDVRDYPFMVKLHMEETPGAFYQCGGALVTPQVVLTAAHCVVYGRYNTKMYSVTAEIKATAEIIEASMLIPHEKNLPNPENIDEATPYDIALIYLKAPSTRVTVFPKLNEQDFEKIGTVVQVIGYGRTEEKKDSDYLKETQVTISDIDDRVHTFFTTSYNTGTCKGDSGGPAFVRSGQDYILVGVTSGGYFNNRTGLCEYDVPELFTSVKGFGDWIKGNLAILN